MDGSFAKLTIMASNKKPLKLTAAFASIFERSMAD